MPIDLAVACTSHLIQGVASVQDLAEDRRSPTNGRRSSRTRCRGIRISGGGWASAGANLAAGANL